MRIGIVGFQGAVAEHMNAVKKAMKKKNIEGKAIWVEEKNQLKDINGLIIPGGESTTIGKLMQRGEMFDKVKKFGQDGIPIMGTCAGLILLAKQGGEEIEKSGQPLLKLMDIKVIRNAFGRQKESFEANLSIPELGNNPFKGVFIRAPAIVETGENVTSLATYRNMIVAAVEDNLLALAFHPELTSDTRFHEYFLEKVKT